MRMMFPTLPRMDGRDDSDRVSCIIDLTVNTMEIKIKGNATDMNTNPSIFSVLLSEERPESPLFLF
jgi:hypothetical protein